LYVFDILFFSSKNSNIPLCSGITLHCVQAPMWGSSIYREGLTSSEDIASYNPPIHCGA